MSLSAPGACNPARYSPIQNHFPRLAGDHLVKAFLEIRIMESVGDHRAEIQAALDHDSHHVPGLVHLPTVNALDGEHIEDNQVPVDGHFLLGDAEQGDLAAVTHV